MPPALLWLSAVATMTGGDLNLRHPMESVTWDDATAFCRKLTEAERKAKRLSKGYHSASRYRFGLDVRGYAILGFRVVPAPEVGARKE